MLQIGGVFFVFLNIIKILGIAEYDIRISTIIDTVL